MLIKLEYYFKNFRILRSLKLRLFLILVLVGLIPTTIMRYAFLGNYVERAVHVRTSDVQNQVNILSNHLTLYNYLQDTSLEVINAELDQLSNLYDGRVLIIDQNFRIVKDTYGISEGKTMISEEIIKCFKGESISNVDNNNHYIEMTTPITDTAEAYAGLGIDASVDSNKPDSIIIGVMLTSVSTDSINATYELLDRKALTIQLIMSVLIIALAFLMSQLLVKPFSRVSSAISEIKDGYTDEPIAVNDYLETEHIVDAFNQLQSRMKVLDDSRQEFVSNVSHELKTPITSMKVLADSLIMQEDAPKELYKEFMVDIAEEIERENKIITDLLSLVKMDKTASGLHVESKDINNLLEIILKRIGPIAESKGIELIYESMREVTAEVDEVKISQAFTNLIENAVKYNREKGSVTVVLDADHQFFTVEVTDTGIGIPQEDVDHIFERFYRVDKSHSTEIGGTGLGLAITRSAILVHRGSIKVTSEEGIGTTFMVKIPLYYIAS